MLFPIRSNIVYLCCNNLSSFLKVAVLFGDNSSSYARYVTVFNSDVNRWINEMSHTSMAEGKGNVVLAMNTYGGVEE
jgi:hypothetical protein